MPAVWNATENLPPGATTPESQPDTSDVDVCAVASVFVHVTVEPTATSSSSGMKALLPSEAAPAGIATDNDGTPGVGDGAGDGAVVGDEYPPPQAAPEIRINETQAMQNDRISTLHMSKSPGLVEYSRQNGTRAWWCRWNISRVCAVCTCVAARRRTTPHSGDRALMDPRAARRRMRCTYEAQAVWTD